MTSLTLSAPRPAFSPADFRAASPLLWWTSLAFLTLFVICVVMAAVDPRLFNGISVWVKPAKFSLSLAVHMLTLSFGLMLLPERAQNSWTVTGVTVTMAAMAIFELAYIAFRAARAEASHFNIGSELAVLIYNLMGAGAAAIMVVTAILGILILRHGAGSLMMRATGSGFVIAAILTLVVGFTLGGMGSHWIGGDRTDATGLPLIGWSTTGGDLRVAHFIGLHVMQVLPALALLRSGSLVAVAALLGVLLTIAAYAQALMGFPLIAL